MKLTHSLISIFSVYDEDYSRNSRFMIYFAKLYGQLTVTALFFNEGDTLDPVKYVIIMVISTIIVTPYGMVLNFLMKNPKRSLQTNTTEKSPNSRYKFARESSGKQKLGAFIYFLELVLCIYFNLVIAASKGRAANYQWTLAFVLQALQDIIIN